jgi:O-antigen/teichoic acid export membrane protein
VFIAVGIVALVSSLANIIQCVVAYRQLECRMGVDFWHGWTWADATKRLSHARRIILSNMGLSVSDLMAKDLDVALLARILSEDKVGLYKMAKTAIQLLWRAIDPFYFAIMPEVQKLWQQNKFSEINRLLARTSALLFGLAIMLVLIGWGGAYWFAEKILGPSFADVPQLMLVMSPWVIICAPLIWGHPVSVAIGRPEYATYGSFISLLVGLISFSYFTAQYDLTGAALAWNLTISSGMLITAAISGYKYRSMFNS